MSLKSKLQPHIRTSPFLLMAPEEECPQETNLILEHLLTITGFFKWVIWVLFSPIPSWPSEASPQAKTFPSRVRARVCIQPQETYITFLISEIYWGKKLIPFPQANKLPSPSMAAEW
jgi:hypothetical protein